MHLSLQSSLPLQSGISPPVFPGSIAAGSLSETSKASSHLGLSDAAASPGVRKKKSSAFLSKVRTFFQESHQPVHAINQLQPTRLQIPTSAYPPISPPHSPGCSPASDRDMSKPPVGEAWAPHSTNQKGIQGESLSLTPSNSSNDNSAGRSDSQQLSQDFKLALSTDRTLGGSVTLRKSKASSDLTTSLQLAPILPAKDHVRIPYNGAASVSGDNRRRTPSLPLDQLEFDRLDVALADYLIELCSDPVTVRSDALHRFFDLRRPVAYTTADYQRSEHSSSNTGPHAVLALEKHSSRTMDTVSRLDTKPGIEQDVLTATSTAKESDQQQPLAQHLSNGDYTYIQNAIKAGPSEAHVIAHSRSLESHSTRVDASRCDKEIVNGVAHDEVPIAASSLESSHVQPSQHLSRKITIDDFDLIRTLGKGCAGKVSYYPIRSACLKGH